MPFSPHSPQVSGTFAPATAGGMSASTYDALGGTYESYEWRYDGFLDIFGATSSPSTGTFSEHSGPSTGAFTETTPAVTGSFTPHGS